MSHETPHLRPERQMLSTLRSLPPGTEVILYINTQNRNSAPELNGATVTVTEKRETRQKGNEAIIVDKQGEVLSLGGGTAAERWPSSSFSANWFSTNNK